MNKLLPLLLVLTLSSAARAQSAISDLAGAAHADAVPFAAEFAAFRQSAQAHQSERPLMIPRDRKDALAACSVIDAKTFRAYTLPEAAGLLQGCLDESFGGRKYAVTSRAAKGSLVIEVRGTILMGDPVLADLNFSLDKRGGKLLGFPASLDGSKAVLAK